MSLFSELTTVLNDSVLAVFGESVVIRQGADEWPSVSMAFTSPNAAQLEWPSGFVQAQFRRSDVPGIRAGAVVISSTAEYRVVEVDQRIEDWTVVKLQKVGNIG